MVENDTRGWILASISGVACIFGACIICIDYVVRLFPGREKFEIRRSDTFLSSSLSLSFGVMLFSALYSMLPESKNYLMKSGRSASEASWIMIGSFLGGVVGIQFLGRLFHHFIPSHVVDCEHSHDEEVESDDHHNDSHSHGVNIGNGHHHSHEVNHVSRSLDGSVHNQSKRKKNGYLAQTPTETDALLGRSRRPGRPKSRVTSFLVPVKDACDEQGPCKGFTDPCGRESFMNKTASPAITPASVAPEPRVVRATAQLSDTLDENHQHSGHTRFDGTDDDEDAQQDFGSGSTATSPPPGSPDIEQALQESHHHHVPDNAFLSIGLQTSLAIALHKLPEGFITYATNHANRKLGFTVFMALFIHNITEGFALALPLFLALNSRWKAIIASSILGGASQPLGAGIAVLYFLAANKGGMEPDETVYGCVFAITSGIMTSVALQLFSESLGRTHNKTLCIAWAFVGMGVLGCSMALTA